MMDAPSPRFLPSRPKVALAGAFIQKNCAPCHNSSAPAARLDLTKLHYEPANPKRK